MKTVLGKPYINLLFLLFILLSGTELYGHCDRKNGPVAVAAGEALKLGDFEKISIWVGKEQEQELKEKFQQSLEIYRQGGKAAELAEEYFMETSVRLHREAEGLPFTGLKEAQPNPEDIEAAEKALDTGNVDPVLYLLSEKMREKISHWFQEAQQAEERKHNSVEAGREWVDTYVKYITYIHGLYQTIEQGPPHGVGE